MSEMTVKQIIEDVKAEVCDKICKYPEKYTPEEWEDVCMDVCDNCPLDRL